MLYKFDEDKIVNYLIALKNKLPEIYYWESKIENLIDLKVITKEQSEVLNNKTRFKKELELKTIIGQKLNEYNKESEEFFQLCHWIIKDWGGIKTGKVKNTENLIMDFLGSKHLSFKRIASISKVAAFINPKKYVIYDSRVSYSLNWILLSEDAGEYFFPMPEGRNSKMSALDISVLIRLKNIEHYYPKESELLNNKKYISKLDDKLFIKKENAYSELIKLVKSINKKLWKGDKEKEANLYYTEMLLFSIADREVFKDITERFNEVLSKN